MLVFIHFARNFEFGCPSMWRWRWHCHVSRWWFGSQLRYIIKFFIDREIMMLRDIFYGLNESWAAPARMARHKSISKRHFITRPLLHPIMDLYNQIKLFKAKRSWPAPIVTTSRIPDHVIVQEKTKVCSGKLRLWSWDCIIEAAQSQLEPMLHCEM